MEYPILIVDDDLQVRHFMNNLLAQQSFPTIQAHDGKSALAKVGEHRGRISLLLTDIDIGWMSGITLAQRVTAEYPAVPVLFMSGDAHSQKSLRLAVPGSGLIRKPFAAAMLIQAVETLLNSQE